MLHFFCVCVCLIMSINAYTIDSTALLKATNKSTVEWVKPGFCNKLDCPKFEVVEEDSGYELRKYQSAQWVSTKYTAMTPDDAQKIQGSSFMKLFHYISGGNDKKAKIPMTAPVLTNVTPGAGPNCESTFVMSFYVPESLQKSAPKPTSSDVYLENLDEMEVYVKSFSGYASQNDYIKQSMELIKEVGEDKIQADEYFTAGYDSPFKFWSRHNECWVMKKSS